MNTCSSFSFVSDCSSLAEPEDFLLTIPNNIKCKSVLLEYYERQGRFPGYFGRNWDALLDCLRDFSWLKNNRIVIAHQDVPLSNQIEDARTYLEILAAAVNDWSAPFPETRVEEACGISYVEHHLVVCFPKTLKEFIVGIVSGD